MINEDEISPGQADRLRQWQEQQAREKNEREAQHHQFTAGYGVYVPGDYAKGQQITYRSRSGGLHRGAVLWSYGPSKTPVTGRQRPLLYLVTSARSGWPPVEVEPGQIVQS